MTSNILIEVCADSVASAVAAQRGGAGRIELCGDLSEGGITPSTGLIELVRERTTIPLHVMIRPCAGDFCYDNAEFEVMRRDIVNAKRLGADGVVFGILDLDGEVDVERTRQLISVARPMRVTFHRAFDMAVDLFRALEDVCSAGVDRILTSGGEPTSVVGRDTIARLVSLAKKRVIIMPGSGINQSNAAELIQKTGVREIHVGLRTSVPSPMRHQNSRITMGSSTAGEYARFQVLEENVRNLVSAVSGL